jgi:hypothetical protein
MCKLVQNGAISAIAEPRSVGPIRESLRFSKSRLQSDLIPMLWQGLWHWIGTLGRRKQFPI